MAFKVSSSSKTIQSLNKATNAVQESMSKLSSGKRITRAAVDPAGLAVAVKMLSEADTLKTGTRNVSYGVSAAQVADGATEQLGGITTRMRELATQSANGTLSDSQRGALETEFQELKQEADRIVATTEFNGQSLLNGGGFSVQVGAGGSENDSIAVDNINVDQALTSEGFGGLSISNAESAQTAISALEGVTNRVSEVRGNLGAVTSRLEKAEQNNISRELGLRESASRIMDVDVAEEVAKLTNNSIKQQVSTALLAQAGRIDRERVLSLLG